ncbi:hypothetical protein OS493_030885 [Desmophyllum pertusum]|uniref:K Homology domain-containing protein n=1 Tax=Desmophyllum pertusum TaxID=174260 RepID=A0A9W9YBW3_9CNID|nr:hypothetical protein OS493_030885 [Desmophyllum pertusum]
MCIMSRRDSEEGEQPKSQRRLRPEGEPSWYDKAVNASYEEEVMQIPNDKGEDSPGQGSWKKLDFIPEKYMGQVIGKNRQSLENIEKITDATLKVFERNSLYIKGSNESQKRAIREIKEIVETSSGFTDIDRLKDKLLMVLREIHKEKEDEEEMVKVSIWCHLGHSYIPKVNEGDEEEEYFTLEEIKEKLENKKSWNPSFKAGLEDMEVEQIEKHLKSRAVKEDIRHDFTFYTPSYRGCSC